MTVIVATGDRRCKVSGLENAGAGVHAVFVGKGSSEDSLHG